MKHIQISDDAYDLLAERHGDVEAFVEQLARDAATADPRGNLSDSQMKESLRRLADADASIDIGGGQDARKALLQVGKELGFKPPA